MFKIFIILAGFSWNVAFAQRGEIGTADDMEYVTVCKTKDDCKQFSRLIMGTDHLAQANWTNDGQSEMNDEELFKVLDEAARLGINFFDTAPIYVGGIENRLGKWLRSRKKWLRGLNPDGKAYVLSKGGFPFDLYDSKKLEGGTHSHGLMTNLAKLGMLSADEPIQPDGSTQLSDVPAGTYASRLFGKPLQINKRVGDELQGTLNNLGDDLTIYLMHRDDEDFIRFDAIRRQQTPVLSIMKALSHPSLANKYWSIGWSNWQTDRVEESVQLANRDPRLIRPSFNSAYFSLFEMSRRSIHAGGVQVSHNEMMDPNFQRGVLQNPYSPLGGFSILDKPEPRWENAKLDAKAKFDAGDAYWQNVYHSIFTPANEARYHRVESFTKKFNQRHRTNYSVDQMINAYALAHKRTDFLTVGPITVEQLRRTVGALRLARSLTAKDLAYLYRGY